MEKISHIVRGNARVAAVDLKGSSAVRPGVPTFGRPNGESPQVTEKGETTAARVTAIQNEMNEIKRVGGEDRAVGQMADQFFMTHVRRPDEEVAPVSAKNKLSAKEADVESTEELMAGESPQTEISQPTGFKPRGTYVDVRA
jgi:hypothetical protein